ncbi:uncharacterized protein LOC124629228 [Ictalurus punctatus]|uniref:Uncharacterized protein LOC124629228 n=1 Tax=Ictalurus punctatus TaxID=7998 RepID=A0A979FDZ7_ICTPU|nr:uncharacterized protein LOC124629228 [Ictalurus punctatus]
MWGRTNRHLQLCSELQLSFSFSDCGILPKGIAMTNKNTIDMISAKHTLSHINKDYQLYYSRYKGNLFELKMVICGAEDVLWHFMPAALVHVVEKKTLKMLNPKDFTVQGHREPGAYPRGLGAQGGGHPGRGANPSQCTIPHTRTLILTLQTIWKCQSAYNACLWTGRGNRSTQRKTLKHGKNMQALRTHRAEVGIEPQTLFLQLLH